MIICELYDSSVLLGTFAFTNNAVFPVQSLLAFSTTPETKGIDAFLLKFVIVKVMAFKISFSLLFLNYHVIPRSTNNVVKTFIYAKLATN